MGIIRRQGVKNAIVYYSGMVIGAVNLIFLFPYFLQPEQFGLTRVLIAAGLILTKFGQLGIPNIIVKYFPYFKNKEKGHQGIFFFALCGGGIGFILFAGISLLFKDQFLDLYRDRSPLFVDYFYYAFIISLSIILYKISFAYARSLWKSVLPNLFREVILRVFTLLLLLGYYIGLYSFPTFLLLFVLGYMLPFLINMLYLVSIGQLFLKPSFDFFKPKLLKEMMSYGFFVLLAGATIVLVNNIDNMMIASMVDEGLSDVAVYTVAFFMGTVIVIPARSIVQIAAPIIADAWKKNDIKEVDKVYKKTALNQFIIGSLILILIWLNIDHLLAFLPDKYSQGKYVVLFIGLSRLVHMGMGVNKQIMMTSRFFRYEFLSNLLLVSLVVITNYLLIPVLEIEGAALATMFSFFAQNLFVFLLVYVKLDLQPFTTKTLKAIVVAAVSYLLGFLIPSMPTYLDLIIRSLIIVIIFGGLTLAWGFSDDVNDTVRTIYRKAMEMLR